MGDMARIPVYFEQSHKEEIDRLVCECIEISKRDWDSDELSWDYKRCPLIQKNMTLQQAYSSWKQKNEASFVRLKSNEEQLNQIFINIYGLGGEVTAEAVSYTHLDVYKRQIYY